MIKQAALALVINKQTKEVLAVSRKYDHSDLGLPGGKVEINETLENAAGRELYEETGLLTVETKPIFACIDSNDYYATTFLVTKVVGTPRKREAGAVLWTPWQGLFQDNCSFKQYNKWLYEVYKSITRE